MMKIVFICGSIEHGRDGVGDYTMRLAQALAKYDHQLAVIAASDTYVEHEITEAINSSITTLRLPANCKHTQRFDKMNSFIKVVNPDWISVQFVPFSFHPKGLPVVFINRLAKLLIGFKVHVMFHELWVGMDKKASLKFKLWGGVQKKLIISFINKLKPKQIHTNTNLYQSYLNKLGFKSDILPLFSNIPVSSEKGIISNDNTINLVLFGSIHYGAPIEQLTNEISAYASSYQKKIVLNFLGKCGSEQDNWIAACSDAKLETKVWGTQSEKNISKILCASNAGITTTPQSLVQKSGSVAAMKEHGLPILCVSRSWEPRAVTDLPDLHGVLIYKPGNFKQLLLMKAIEIDNMLENVVYQFLLTISQ